MVICEFIIKVFVVYVGIVKGKFLFVVVGVGDGIVG